MHDVKPTAAAAPPARINQLIKLAVYSLLFVNFAVYVANDHELAGHTVHDGWTWLDWTTAYATSLDTSVIPDSLEQDLRKGRIAKILAKSPIKVSITWASGIWTTYTNLDLDTQDLALGGPEMSGALNFGDMSIGGHSHHH